MIRLFSGFTLLIIMMLVSPLWAGGPISVQSTTGTSVYWDGDISIHPETGSCASFSNSDMLTKIETITSVWESVSNVDLTINVVTGSITSDVDASSYTTYFVDDASDPGLNDNLNPIIFDEDGGIVAALFGASARFSVLGFAGPDGFSGSNTAIIVDGQAFFNCRCVSGNAEGACPSNVVFTEDDVNFTILHELGHFLGLDHTQVNQSIAEGTCDTSTTGDCTDVPTMYPQSVDAGDQYTLHTDDIVAIQTLYGTSTFSSSTCTVRGTLKDSAGKALRCADVQATTSDTADTISYVSGSNATFTDNDSNGFSDGDGECNTDCGVFTLRGLDPAKTYTLTVKPVSSSWTGGSSVGPCASGQISTITTEVISSYDDSNCVANATVDLCEITTTSTGGVTEQGTSTLPTACGGGGGGGGSSSGSGSSGCGLVPHAGLSSVFGLSCLMVLMGLVFMGWRWRRG